MSDLLFKIFIFDDYLYNVSVSETAIPEQLIPNLNLHDKCWFYRFIIS